MALFKFPLFFNVLALVTLCVGTGRPRRRPAGKVVAGQYIVHPKKTRDKGARPRPRVRRDQGWKRSAIGPVDPYLRTGMQALLPSAAYPSRDPRRQSRFLGHVIDGTLGWATDFVHHIPLVGPLVGHPMRVVCRVVRGVENAANAITGTVGVHLFIVMALACLLPTAMGVTNCCSEEQVTYCTDVTCLHESGCAICQQSEDQVICWEPHGIMVSHHPNYTGVDSFLTHHIDAIAGLIFTCDLAGMREACGIMTLATSWFLDHIPHGIQLNTTADCFLLVESGINPLTSSFFTWIAEEFNTITALVDFIGKIPVALAHAFTQSHFIAMCSIAGLALNGNVVKALALTVLYIEAAAAAPVQSSIQRPVAWNETCPMFGTVEMCANKTAYTGKTGWCFNPKTGFRRLVDDWPVDGWFCVWTGENGDIRSEPACCSLRRRPSYCTCTTDCSWKDKRQTFESCGASLVFSTACSKAAIQSLSSVLPTLPPSEGIPKADCFPTPVAYLNLPGYYWGPDWRASYVYLEHGHTTGYWYNPKVLGKLSPKDWARLPGTPPSYKGSWMLVPDGMYSTRRDISSGLIMKDKNYKDYQLLFSGIGTYILPGITTHVAIIALLAALGARWCLVLYALLNIVPLSFAFTPEILASTAASPWPDPVTRAFVYLATLYREPLSIPLSGSAAAFFLSLFHTVAAFSIDDCLFAAASVGFFASWAGLFSHFVPTLILTQSYLRVRLEAASHSLLNRSLLFLCVLIWPKAVWNTCLCLWIIWIGLVAGGRLLVAVLGPKDKLSLMRTLSRLNRCAKIVARTVRPIVIWAAGERGVFWFEHIDGKLDGDWQYSEPYYPFETEVLIAEDTGRKLACGDAIKGLPVHARIGSTVRAGIAQLPKGWLKTVPFSARFTSTRGQMKALAVCLTGTDAAEYKGSIAILGTPLRTWMGFGCKGSLYTVHHGARARALASADGPKHPILVNKEKDMVKYPLPKGFTSLPVADCSCTEFFLVTKVGNLVPCVRAENRMINTGPLTLREAKGSSGAPVLCKCGKVKAMFLSVRSSRGIVSSLGVVPITADQESDSRPAESDGLEVPRVSKDQKQIRRLIAPTGSGKTTKLPMEYYKDGYTVLVLNPSVATTRSVPKYMKEKYNVTPNVRTGDHCENHGSRLTYSTYGMFNTQPVLDADVVICDEVHATDGTTVLGIGNCLRAFEKSAKAKLLILATATPPGTPMKPHPNITTHDLPDDGDIPFHGKRIKLDILRKGRHLIFSPGKKHCDLLAQDLMNAGINAVSYYRGKDAKCIPVEGDVVVVATDALMTGYTGDFDTVIDSCLSVTPTYEVTMNPTFQVGVRMTNSDAVTRMQRRGRTGRGKPGVYYQVTPHCTTHGTVPTACVIEAFDSGMAYFGMTPAEVATALSYYKDESLTPALEVSIPELQNIFMSLGYVDHAIIDRMKDKADNYTYLYAAQYQLAKHCNAMAPNDNPIWRGLTGKEKFPVLYDLEDYDQDKVVISAQADRIAACYEEFFTGTLVTLAGVGLATAAVFTAVDMLGNITIRRVMEITTDSTAARVAECAPDDITEQLEECANWEGFAEAVNRASRWLADKVTELGVSMGGQHPTVKDAMKWLPHLLAGIQYFAGLATLQDAPGLGAVLGFIGGTLSPLPLKANLFLSALGGAFGARLTTQRGAAAFALASALGASAGAAGLASMMTTALTTYGGATATCLVVLKLIDGQMPEISELASLAFNITNPGACVVGAAAALMVAYCTRAESNVWMNRLLAMLHRGSSCEDYYVAATTLRTSIIRLLEQANLWAVFRSIASWINKQDEDLCTPRGAFLEFYDAVGRVLRLLVEATRGFLKRTLKLPSVPIALCDAGYSGPWAGNGIVRTQCECGAEQVWNITEGKAQWVSGPAYCRSWWTGKVPVNSAMIGCCRPRPASWKTMAVNTGFNSYVTYKRDGTDVWVTGVSNPDQVVECIVPDLLSAVAVDGVQVKPFGGSGWRDVGKFTCRLRRAKETHQMQIPFKLEPTKEPFREVPVAPPIIGAMVSQTERCVGMVKAARRSSLEGTLGCNNGSKAPKHILEGSDDGFGTGADLIRSLARGAEKTAALREKDLDKPPIGGISFGVEAEVLDRARSPIFEPPKPKQTKGMLDEAKEKSIMEKVFDIRPRKPLIGPLDLFFPLVRKGPGMVSIKLAAAPVVKSKLNPEAKPFAVKPVVPKLKKGAKPLPKIPPKGASVSTESTYSLHSSSWSGSESEEHICSSWSYTWSAPSLVYKGFRRVVSAVSSYTSGIMRYKPLVYVTEPSTINDRIKKVTIQRHRTVTAEFRDVVRAAKARVRTLQQVEMTLAEALSITHNKTAKSAVTGLTAKDLKAGRNLHVQELYNQLETGQIPSPWDQVNIMPKSEVFVKTPQKQTKKPARIIAYPHLETRVVEKMVLGNIGPATVKAVCGEAYGFVPPKERVQKLLKMWESKAEPAGFTCDTVCFDSTITPEDVAVESELYQCATTDEKTRLRIRTLHDCLYKGGPMVMQGAHVGVRHCRASGVFTTSSSNTMTCFLKVSAAAKKAGIRKPSWLICGDDTVCIFESDGEAEDKRRLGLFAVYMKELGAPQGEVPRPHYSLELLDSCSSNVSVAQTKQGMYHYMTRDPRIPLGRISIEGQGFNPLGSMLGYILANYPAMWVSRCIAVKFMQELVAQEKLDTITFDWYGNNYTVPIRKIPYIIEALHGNQAWHITNYTSREVARVSQSLKDNTIRPLRYYKRTARSIVAVCRQRGGVLRFLADTLLAWTTGRRVTLDPREVEKARLLKFYEPYSQDIYGVEKTPWPASAIFGLFVGALVILATLYGIA
nr:polyprotein [Rodent hepacivirus]